MVALAILDPARFYVDITGDERDTPPSSLEGTNDSLALGGNIDPASIIIKFEVRVVAVAQLGQQSINDEDGAAYLRVEEETTTYLPFVSK